jgi:ELWxxDGT repeat protein
MPEKAHRTTRRRVAPIGFAALATLLALAAGGAAARAQPAPAFLVRDLDASPPAEAPTNPRPGVAMGGWVYFSAGDPHHGLELWRTDGTAAGTELFLDICTGPCHSAPDNMAVLGGRLFFTADDGVHGREPWVSDGTRAGTHLLYDVCPGACDSIAALGPGTPWIAAAGATVLMTLRDGTTADFQLWRTDGSPQGTAKVTADLPTQQGGLTSFAGRVFYVSTDAAGHNRLVRSDGTAAGTAALPDFCTGPCNPGFRVVVATDSRMLVVGTSQTATDVFSLDRDGAVQSLPGLCAGLCGNWDGAAVGGWAYVTSSDFVSSTLWRTDLVPGGAITLLHTSMQQPASLTTAGGRLFFVQFDNRDPLSGLWTSDGTPEGTRRLSGVVGNWLQTFGGGVIFNGLYGNQREDPWVSDGTPAGTRLVASLAPDLINGSNPHNFVALGSQLIFAAQRSSSYIDELWRTDTTAAGTALVRDPLLAPASSDPFGLMPFAGRLYFFASRRAAGTGLWRSDGTGAGTVRLQNAVPSFTSTVPVAVGDRLFFPTPTSAGDLLLASQLSVTDAAGATATAVGGGISPTDLTPLDGTLYFTAGVGYFGSEGRLLEVPPGGQQAQVIAVNNPDTAAAIPADPHDLLPLGGKLLMAAGDGVHGDELWVSDGTAAGTSMVADLCPGPCASRPSRFVALAGFALFATASDEFGAGLWRTDGTAAGTFQLAAFPGRPLLGGAGPREPVVLGSKAYFLVTLPARDELWASDGTIAGTRRVSRLELDGSPARAHHLAVSGRLLFLAVHHASTGEELWASDGTALGTRQVADLNPGPASASPQALTAVDGRLVFAASDGESGLEPWVSDGTPLGTVHIQDVLPGPDGSAPAGFRVAGDLLYFSADDGVHGRELWAVPRASLASPACQTGDTTLCLAGRFAITVDWKDAGGQGPGHAVNRSSETGLFWFFDPDNPELLVKMLNAGALNGSYWLFAAGLSDVDYRLTVRDVLSGRTRTYHNAGGHLCGLADTAAFPVTSPGTPSGLADTLTAPSNRAPARPAPAATAATAAAAGGTCQPDPHVLCLLDGRFRLEARFAAGPGGGMQPATAVPAGDRAGFFWFFGSGNLELAVKLVDGAAANGHEWFFYGALSDVAYTVSVTDTVTGTHKTYRNRQGQLCGRADTETF